MISSAKDIEERTVVTEYEDDEGIYTDARTVVMIHCQDGVCRSFDPALTGVLNYWGREVERITGVDYSPRATPETPGARFVPRSRGDSCKLRGCFRTNLGASTFSF